MPTPPSNDARALHVVLSRLNADSNRASQAWPELLGAGWDSIEFARRHAEAVGLYVGTLSLIEELPEDSRDLYMKYAFAWWKGLIGPENNWASNEPAGVLVNDTSLDFLHGAAALIEQRLAGTLAVPDSANLIELGEVCQEWIGAVRDSDGLAAALKHELLRDLEHLGWLIVHADTFGVGAVARAGQQVVGAVVSVAPELGATPEAGTWKARLGKLVYLLGLLASLHHGFDDAQWAIHGGSSIVGELMPGGSEGDTQAPGPVGETPAGGTTSDA